VVSTWDPIAQVTCFEDHCETITVISDDPCDAFEACFVPSPAGPSAVFFNNCTSNEPGTQFIWDFGDGTTANGVAPTHTYAQPGNYTVCLSAFWQNCSDSTCTTITVGVVDPCSGLNAAFTHITTPNGTHFSNGTTGTGFQTQFLWHFGDGTTSTDAQPDHMYTSDGVYEVCLEVLSMYQVDGGVTTCVDSTCTTVIIGAGDPCVDFEACILVNDPIDGVYLFENCSSQIQGTQFYWEFGDGFSSSDVIAEHAYGQPGTYTVCLFAYYQNCADSTCTTVTVPGDDPCEGLSAGFAHFTTPNGTQFSNGTTGTGFQTQFFWDFGDGNTSTDAQPFHTYAQDGFYEVCMQALSLFQVDGGVITCVDTTCTLVTIGTGDPCDMLVACFEPQPFENGVYHFQNCSEILPIDIPEYYFWDFGDGSSSTDAEPDHSFLPGTYTVCLMVEHGDCVDSTCTTITVGGENPCDALDAGFIASGGLGMNFANDVVDFSWAYHWDFGDGSAGNGPSPYHLYPASGTYEVCLTVSTWDPIAQDSCFESNCQFITVFDGVGCDPNFACEFTWDAQGTLVVFVGTANRETDGMVWDLGDGTTGYGDVYTHLYEPPGPFEVCLNAWYWNETTQDSCWTSTCMVVDPFNVITGIGDMAFADVNVFPNPAKDGVTISGLPSNGELRLFAPDGRLVLTDRATAELHQMSVGHLATGVYVLQVRVDGGLFVQRVSIE
jgi:PKD repeat protein